MANAIPLNILAQIIAAFLAVSALAMLGGIIIGITARYSETVHRALCAIYRAI